MKTMISGFILGLVFVNSASAMQLPVAGKYSVVFSTLIENCAGKQSTDSYTFNFGERDRQGNCLDDAKLACITRFTYSLGRGFALETLDGIEGPRICTSGRDCVEAQFSFERTSNAAGDVVKVATYGFRDGDPIFSNPALLNVSQLLGQARRYVLDLDACQFAIVTFKVTAR